MLLLFHLVLVFHLAIVSGAPNAEAVPDAGADAEAGADADAVAEADAQYQFGGPGVSRSRSWSRSWSGSSPQELEEGPEVTRTRSWSRSWSSGSVPQEGDLEPEVTQTRSWSASSWSGAAPQSEMEAAARMSSSQLVQAQQSAGYYQSSAAQMAEAQEEQPARYYGNPADVGPYGSLSVTSEGNVLPLESTLQLGEQIPGISTAYQARRPISYQPSPPISYQPSPPISYQPSPPISYQPSPVYQRPPYYTPATTLPAAPVFGAAPLLNSQNMMFTRSYTSIPGSNCMNVCRQRPTLTAQPTCGTACNVRPACQMTRPMVDYAVAGNTLNCRPRPVADLAQISYSRPAYNPQPIIQQSGCGSSYSGCAQSVGGAVTLPQPVYSTDQTYSFGQGYNPGLTQGYNPGLTQSYSPVLTSSYNPGLTTSYSPVLASSYSPVLASSYSPDLTTSYSPVLTQSYNPGLSSSYSSSGPCLGSGCTVAAQTNTAGPVFAATLPETISTAEASP